MASVTQPVPQQEALMVELPGYVRDSAAALDALGGTDAVAAAAGGHAPYLRLRLRGGDPMAHPLLGDRRPARGLLLRISRAPGGATQGEASGELRTEVVARVTGAVHFGGLADFQYVSCDPRPPSEQVPPGEGPTGLPAEPPLCPPQLFTKQDVPQDYAFAPFYAGDPDHMKAATNIGRVNVGRGRMARHVINFQDVNAPAALTEPGAEEAGLWKERRAHLRDVAALFARRPVWAGNAISEAVPGMTAAEFDILLPRLAYLFRNGPWKGLWIKRGYDPRADFASRVYQAMECKTFSSGHMGAAVRRIDGAVAGPTYQEIHRFAARPLPGAGNPLIVGDLQDLHIQALLQRAPHQPTPSSATGWFTPQAWHDLLAIVEERFTAVAGPRTQAPLSAAARPLQIPAAPGGPVPAAAAGAGGLGALVTRVQQQQAPLTTEVLHVTGTGLQSAPGAAGGAAALAGQPDGASNPQQSSAPNAGAERRGAAVREPDQALGASHAVVEEPGQAGLLGSMLAAVPSSQGTPSNAVVRGGAPRGAAAVQVAQEPDEFGAGFRAMLMSEAEQAGDFQIYEDDEEEQGNVGGQGEAGPNGNGVHAAGEHSGDDVDNQAYDSEEEEEDDSHEDEADNAMEE